MWKARLCIDDLRIPVTLFAAVRATGVHFRLLHAEDLAPVKQQMVDPARDRVIAADQIQRALEVERGVFVILTEAERAANQPRPSRDIRVEQLVAVPALDLRWFVRPYYLGPDGDSEGYFALADALAERGVFAIARWVMRKKNHQGALYSHDGYLALATLRHPEDLVEVEGIRPAAERAMAAHAIDDRELALARQLVASLEADQLDASAHHDEYRARLEELIESKVSGRLIEFPRASQTVPGESLIADLEASLRQLREAAGG